MRFRGFRGSGLFGLGLGVERRVGGGGRGCPSLPSLSGVGSGRVGLGTFKLSKIELIYKGKKFKVPPFAI